MHRALIVGCLTASTLRLSRRGAFSAAEKEKHEKPKTTPDNVQRASARRIAFYNDLKTLRRDLRHHLNPTTIAEDRSRRPRGLDEYCRGPRSTRAGIERLADRTGATPATIRVVAEAAFVARRKVLPRD